MWPVSRRCRPLSTVRRRLNWSKKSCKRSNLTIMASQVYWSSSWMITTNCVISWRRLFRFENAKINQFQFMTSVRETLTPNQRSLPDAPLLNDSGGDRRGWQQNWAPAHYHTLAQLQARLALLNRKFGYQCTTETGPVTHFVFLPWCDNYIR